MAREAVKALEAAKPGDCDKVVTLGDLEKDYDYVLYLLQNYKIAYHSSDTFFVWDEKGVWVERVNVKMKQDVLECIVLAGNDPTSRKVNNILELLKIKAFQEVDLHDGLHYINFKNGFLNLRSMKLEEHTHKVFSTYQMPCEYDPDRYIEAGINPLSMFLGFLKDVSCGDNQMIMLIQEMFGLCMTMDTTFQKAFFLYGEGGNGKSVLTYVLENLVGTPNISNVDFHDLSREFNRATLFGKLINTSAELDFSNTAPSAMFKAIVSGDMISASNKNKPLFSFRPFCKMVFNANKLPVTRDSTNGFFRRLVIIPFNATFNEETADENLKYKIVSKELDAIAIWAIAGYKRLKKNKKFTKVDVSDKAKDDYRKQSNSVVQFVEDECVLPEAGSKGNGGLWTNAGVLMTNYTNYCHANNLKALGSHNVTRELKAHYGIVKSRDFNPRRYLGIKADRHASAENSPL